MAERPAEALVVTAPATSANLGPGFDVLALALDLSNVVHVTPRPGPFAMSIEGEGAGELPADETNLFCRALESGIGSLEGLEVVCTNRVPLGRGLGSSSTAICAGLVAANALGGLRWTPDDLLERADRLEGHADNAAACLTGGVVAVAPGPRAVPVAVPDDLGFVLVIPDEQVSTSDARGAMPAEVPLEDAATTLCHGIGLVMALAESRLDDLPALLVDRLHEPYRGAAMPGLEALRGLVGRDGCLGVTISGSGPSALVWCRADSAAALASAIEDLLGPGTRARVSQLAPTGVRARWAGNESARLERAIG